MPFNQKPQKFNANINTVEIGCGDKAIKLGGECTFPFYTFVLLLKMTKSRCGNLRYGII